MAATVFLGGNEKNEPFVSATTPMNKESNFMYITTGGKNDHQSEKDNHDRFDPWTCAVVLFPGFNPKI
jgi:hypothetical protein